MSAVRESIGFIAAPAPSPRSASSSVRAVSARAEITAARLPNSRCSCSPAGVTGTPYEFATARRDDAEQPERQSPGAERLRQRLLGHPSDGLRHGALLT